MGPIYCVFSMRPVQEGIGGKNSADQGKLMSNRVLMFGKEVTPNTTQDFHKYSDLTHCLLHDLTTHSPTVFFVDLPNKYLESKIRSKYREYLMVLVRVEPRTVNPRQYVSSIYQRFDLVIGGHERPNALFAPWSTGYLAPNPTKISRQEAVNNGVVLIASRKISLVQGELYSSRDLVIEALAKSGTMVTVVGDGWGKPRTKPVIAALLRTPRKLRRPNSLGASIHQWYFKKPKHQHINYVGVKTDAEFQMSRHQCTLVIENEATYISEKLINALQASRKVLYLGKELALPNLKCGCFMGYSDATDLLSDIEAGVIGDFIDRESLCTPSSHDVTRDLVESFQVKSRIGDLKKILACELARG